LRVTRLLKMRELNLTVVLEQVAGDPLTEIRDRGEGQEFVPFS
jgi:hypothetical protein